MKIAKTREVKSPQRGTSLSAGIDFFVPKFDEEFAKDFVEKNPSYSFIMEDTLEKLQMIVKPHHKVLIPSGIKVNFEGKPKALIAFNKSGVSVKKGLDVLACVIDQDYQGEIHLSLVNTGEKDVIVFQDEKIVQFIMIPIVYEDWDEVREDELWSAGTERGEGGFGSTNK